MLIGAVSFMKETYGDNIDKQMYDERCLFQCASRLHQMFICSLKNLNWATNIQSDAAITLQTHVQMVGHGY